MQRLQRRHDQVVVGKRERDGKPHQQQPLHPGQRRPAAPLADKGAYCEPGDRAIGC